MIAKILGVSCEKHPIMTISKLAKLYPRKKREDL